MDDSDRIKNLQLRSEYRRKAYGLWTLRDSSSDEDWKLALEMALRDKKDLFSLEVDKYRVSEKRKFYSYRNFSYLDSTIDDIKNGNITLVNPALFNDPYDCRAGRKAMQSIVKSHLVKFRENLDLAISKQRVVNKVMGRNQDSEIDIDQLFTTVNAEVSSHEFLDQRSEVARSTVFVKCFSTKLDSMYFWSHYSEGHKGYCIEYEVEELEFCKGFEPVEYVKKWPNDLDDLFTRNFSPSFVLVKSQDWSAELEWRIYHFLKHDEILGKKFIKCALPSGIKITAIYLGLDFEKNDENLKKTFENFYKNSDKKVYQMKLGDGDFGIEVGELIKS